MKVQKPLYSVYQYTWLWPASYLHVATVKRDKIILILDHTYRLSDVPVREPRQTWAQQERPTSTCWVFYQAAPQRRERWWGSSTGMLPDGEKCGNINLKHGPFCDLEIVKIYSLISRLSGGRYEARYTVGGGTIDANWFIKWVECGKI